MSRHSPPPLVRPEGVRFMRGLGFAILSEVVAVGVAMVLILVAHVAVSGRI